MQKQRTFSKDSSGNRICRVSFWTTKQIKTLITKNWDIINFPLTARTRPEPNKTDFKHIPFRSERDFIEFWIRAVCSASPSIYRFLSEFINPDYPEDKK